LGCSPNIFLGLFSTEAGAVICSASGDLPILAYYIPHCEKIKFQKPNSKLQKNDDKYQKYKHFDHCDLSAEGLAMVIIVIILENTAMKNLLGI
jgi:hypothetical protein